MYWCLGVTGTRKSIEIVADDLGAGLRDFDGFMYTFWS